MASTLVGSNHISTRMEVNGSSKHSNLLGHGNNYWCKKFYSTGPRVELTDNDKHTIYLTIR
jgi:hypothetical protein